MKMRKSIFVLLATLCWHISVAQIKKLPLTSQDEFTPVHVEVSTETYLGKASVRLVDPGNTNFSQVTYAKIKNLRFQNGTIELELAGKPLATAGEGARGFVGIAFRVADDDSKFECIYLRPTNGRAEDQVRRNHSVQYISYPDFPWEKSRKETPEKYESYVDLAVGEWTKVKIEIQGNKARLYVHGASQPSLIVNDLKHGPAQEGAIALWIGPGTDAHFTNLVVTPN
ncbi:hypothetical protein H3H32_21825 [Spirosoma foliorum]|uniref:3-keto-disaccharide hydrolase domain-containing protein n=2 Tax=Spirosoma foliorum TaxID=2710596 RepID=A0A7G5GP33_9BACT|nr:hypothetical protein H3H32_21825 [Spirosoma foliorum]